MPQCPGQPPETLAPQCQVPSLRNPAIDPTSNTHVHCPQPVICVSPRVPISDLRNPGHHELTGDSGGELHSGETGGRAQRRATCSSPPAPAWMTYPPSWPFGQSRQDAPISWGRSNRQGHAESALLGLRSRNTWGLEGGIHTVAQSLLGAAAPEGVAAAESARSSPHSLPEVCQTGMSWQLGPFGQVTTFWTLVSLYVKSREHSLSLFARGRSNQGGHLYRALTPVLVPGAAASVGNQQHPVLIEVRLWQGETENTQGNRASIPGGDPQGLHGSPVLFLLALSLLSPSPCPPPPLPPLLCSASTGGLKTFPKLQLGSASGKSW